MKNVANLIASLMLGFLMTACSSDAPEPVMQTFQAMFPDATEVEWELEEENTWEAEFEMDGIEFTACFSAEGEWIETESEVKTDGMPFEVEAAIDSTYAGFEIMESSWVETPDFKGYELEISKIGDIKTELEVLVTPDGQIIREEAEKEDEDGDED